MLKNFKYYAGLADADAYIGLSFNKSTDGTYLVYSVVKYAFRWDTAHKVLPDLCEHFNVETFHVEKELGHPQEAVQLTGKKAVRLLEQLKKHSVLKRELMEWVCSMNATKLEEKDLKAVRKKLKDLRSDTSPSKRQYPSRQWLAGYIDGDGCFATVYDKKYGGLVFRLMITSHRDDPQGIELIRDTYGGLIQVRKDKNYCYYLTLAGAGKSEKLLSGVLPHLRVKRVQADLVRHTLRTGRHLKKNGATAQSNKELHERMKQLKKPNESQRLSEITPEGEATV